jgi:hypothetical protein
MFRISKQRNQRCSLIQSYPTPTNLNRSLNLCIQLHLHLKIKRSSTFEMGSPEILSRKISRIILQNKVQTLQCDKKRSKLKYKILKDWVP